MIVESRSPTTRGCILYDASRVRKAVDEIFDPAWWSSNGGIAEVTGGRGSVALLEYEDQRWVLRRYKRGGFIANLSKDRYLWAGEPQVRSFAEWRLLAHLSDLGLPVPAPIAARYVRGALTYTADLITELVPDATTLARAMVGSGVEENVWKSVGKTIADFHRHGVYHADLNAHNVLLRSHSAIRSAQASSDFHAQQVKLEAASVHIYLLDFDRGRIRERGPWENEVIARFRRSLEKISRQAGHAFDERQWIWVMEGYGFAGRD